MSDSNRKKRYCVFGCADLGASMHNFPHPERKAELFQAWCAIVGDKIRETDAWRIFKNKRICDYHFTPEDKVASHRLINMAVPSLYLDGVFMSPGLGIEIEHNYCLPKIGNSAQLLQQNDVNVDMKAMDEGLYERLHPTEHPSTSGTIPHKGLQSLEHLHKKYKTAQKENRRLKAQLGKSLKKTKHFKERLASLSSLLEGSDDIKRVTKKMTLSGKIFTEMQCRQSLKKPKGRRYKKAEKVLALSIFKKSPKCYNLLYKYFHLPSPKTLRNLLYDIKINSGINDCIFNKLKETVDELSAEDRLCTLIFDEMSLTPNVQYNAVTDELQGFVSHDSTINIATHAMVFMIKGIKKNFKQPVAYFFTQSLNSLELKNIIKEIFIRIQRTGLKVICTVCDQGSANVGAINSLVRDTKEKYLRAGKEWRFECFEIGGQRIIPIFDVPHLIKCIRNNLLNKDLIYRDAGDENKEKKIKWHFFQMLYEADKTRGELRCLHKLTEEHINPAKIKKMRVKMATQIFSHSVATTTDHFIARELLPEECRQLVPFVLLIDKLFDSLNAGTFHVPNGKIYKGAVRKNSPHHKLWREAIMVLKSTRYIVQKQNGNKIRLVEIQISTIKNFIKTIEGIQAIWKILSEKYSLDCMLTRNFNQDPVENFFGNIRSLGVRNNSPTCSSFEGAFKALLLNNFSSNRAINVNCEEDFNSYLQTLDFLLTKKKSQENKIKKSLQISDQLLSTLASETLVNDTRSSTQARYVCGWVLTKCLKKVVKNCAICKDTLLSKKQNEAGTLMQAKEYSTQRWLCYPSDELDLFFREIQEVTVTYLKTNLTKKYLRQNIMSLTDSFITFPSSCEEHKKNVKNYFTITTINVLIFSWCRSINRILSGKISYRGDDDLVKKSAQIYYDTHKNKKK